MGEGRGEGELLFVPLSSLIISPQLEESEEEDNI